MRIQREGNKFVALMDLEDIQGGLGKSIYNRGPFFAPGTLNIDYISEPGIIKPNLQLTLDGGTIFNTRVIRGVTKASNGTVYGIGAKSDGTLQDFFSITLGTTSTATSVDEGTGSGWAEGTTFVEWADYLWAYESTTLLAKIGPVSGTALIVQGNGSPNTPATLTGNLGLDI